MSTKRNFEIKMLSYNDIMSTNNPDEVLFNNNKIITSDLGDEVQSQIELIAALASDATINLGASAVAVVYLENLDSTLALTFKINGGLSMTLGPGDALYFESKNASGVGQITSLSVSNSDATNSIKLKVFVATV